MRIVYSAVISSDDTAAPVWVATDLHGRPVPQQEDTMDRQASIRRLSGVEAFQRCLTAFVAGTCCANLLFEEGECTLSPWAPRLTSVAPLPHLRGLVGACATVTLALHMGLKARNTGWLFLAHSYVSVATTITGLATGLGLRLGEMRGLWTCRQEQSSPQDSFAPSLLQPSAGPAMALAQASLGVAQAGAIIGVCLAMARVGQGIWDGSAQRNRPSADASEARGAVPSLGGRKRSTLSRCRAHSGPRGPAVAQKSGAAGLPQTSAPSAPPAVGQPRTASSTLVRPCPTGSSRASQAPTDTGHTAPQRLLAQLVDIGRLPQPSHSASQDPPAVRRLCDMFIDLLPEPADADALAVAYHTMPAPRAQAAWAGWQAVSLRRERKRGGRLAHACQSGWAQAVQQVLEPTR